MSLRAATPIAANENHAPSSSTELAVRPKVLRRPAHFSGTNPLHEIISPEPVSIPLFPPKAEFSTTSWQDDGRFGLVLLAIVAIINISLMLWLPHMHHLAVKDISYDIHDDAVAERADRKAQVTLYAQPASEWRSPQIYDLRNLPPEQNALSVSPNDIPAPRAKTLTPNLEQ